MLLFVINSGSKPSHRITPDTASHDGADATLRKRNTKFDKRPVKQVDTPADSAEVLPSLSGILTLSEIKALTYAISDDCMEKQDWRYTKAGQVKSEEWGLEIYPRGFVNALRKVLKEVGHE
jgi:hypothetical protein